MIKLKFNLALLILIPTIGFSQVNDTIELPIKKAIILVFKDKPVFQTGFANIVPSVQENKLIIRYGYPNTKKKTFEVVRIEIGIIEGTDLNEAQETVNNQGFVVGHSDEVVIAEHPNPFWGNFTIETIIAMKKKLDSLETMTEKYMKSDKYEAMDFAEDVREILGYK